MNELPNTVVDTIDWVAAFNPKALEKLHIDIVPHPEETTMMLACGMVYPISDKIKEAIDSVFKSEMEIAHGSWSFLKTHLDTVIATFHDWGYATEVHDAVEMTD